MDIYLGPVPLEEVLFYLLTAAMVVQGFVIFWGGACDSWQQLALPRLRQRRLARADGQRERYVQHEQQSSLAPPPHPTTVGTPDA